MHKLNIQLVFARKEYNILLQKKFKIIYGSKSFNAFQLKLIIWGFKVFIQIGRNFSFSINFLSRTKYDFDSFSISVDNTSDLHLSILSQYMQTVGTRYGGWIDEESRWSCPDVHGGQIYEENIWPCLSWHGGWIDEESRWSCLDGHGG